MWFSSLVCTPTPPFDCEYIQCAKYIEGIKSIFFIKILWSRVSKASFIQIKVLTHTLLALSGLSKSLYRSSALCSFFSSNNQGEKMCTNLYHQSKQQVSGKTHHDKIYVLNIHNCELVEHCAIQSNCILYVTISDYQYYMQLPSPLAVRVFR